MLRAVTTILLLTSASAFSPALKPRAGLSQRPPVTRSVGPSYTTTALRAQRRSWSEEDLKDATTPPYTTPSREVSASLAVDATAVSETTAPTTTTPPPRRHCQHYLPHHRRRQQRWVQWLSSRCPSLRWPKGRCVDTIETAVASVPLCAHQQYQQ